MGRLIGLELHNFKSYKGTASIGFGTSCFTSIIGPNGAGKSNMMDAISFVLGIKSSHLRSQTITDLIYRGRLEHSDLPDASRDTITQLSNPTSAYVKAVYEKDDGEKIEFKRSIQANGSTDYQIDESAVTATHYSNVLKNEGILIKAKNFLVFQGDVELIASQTPKDLTRLIETISGSLELAKEFDELKDEADKAHELTNTVFARKRNLNSELRQYKEQMVEQQLFDTKLMAKSDLMKIINLYKLYHNEFKHDELSELLGVKLLELKDLNVNIQSEEDQLKEIASEYSNQILNQLKIDDKIISAKAKIDEKHRASLPSIANQKSLVSRINNHRFKVKDLSGEISKRQTDIGVIEQQFKAVTKEFEKFEDKINKSISASKLSPQVHQEYEGLRNQYLSSGGSELEEEISLLINEKESIDSDIKLKKEQIETCENIITELEFNKNTEVNYKLNSINSQISDLLSTKNDKISLKNQMIKDMEDFNYQELNLNTELRNVLTKLDDLTARQRESNRYKRQREILLTLRNFLPNGSIKGFVYELIRPTNARYDAALATLLGRNFDSIIVESTAVAHQCISVLKERRLGVATFIPLDSISSPSLNLNFLRSIHPNAQPGVDIVDIDDKSLENAINYVIGDALIVDSLSVARELKWGGANVTNQLVTLEGSLINKSGLMTAGISNRSENLHWDKNEIKTLSDLKADLLHKLEQINETKPKEMEINMINDSITEIEESLPNLRRQKEALENSVKDKDTEISFNKSLIKDTKDLIKQKKHEIKLIDVKIKNVNLKVDDIQKSLFADFCKKYKFKGGVKDYEEVHGASLRVKSKERAQFNKMIVTLSNRLKFDKESLEETESRKEHLESEISDFESQLQQLVNEKDKLDKQLAMVEAEYEVLTQDKANFGDLLNDLTKQIASKESNIRERKSEIGSLSKSITQTEEMILKLDIERVNILKNCKIENIMIPLMEGMLDQISLNESVDQLVKKIYELEIDYDMLEDRFRENYNIRMEAELRAKLEKINEELESLTPNAKASERLKESEARLREFERDFTEARQRENRANVKFNEVKNKRNELFSKAFEHISDRIDGIYKELTKTASSPMGGSAYLTLESDDEPFLHGIKYHAMPPMKRFRDMELLSGGEKTMAALALLFAIHSFQPSPFFVLDEVDAALDSANVNRIANYIKKTSSPTFQFIVISLKNALFEKSDALVGIYREQQQNSSRTVTLDLREYPDEEVMAT